jgi:copper ion binding protein
MDRLGVLGTAAPVVHRQRRNLMITTTFQVEGMSCGHCVNSVQSEVSAIAGVSAVEVDLATGQVTVTSAAPIDADAVRAAVDEAGYEVVT